MKPKLALAAVLCSTAIFAVAASPATAAKMSPKQATAVCKAQRSANVASFRAKFGPRKKAMARCVAAKSLADIVSMLPAFDPSQLPQLPQPACDAINSALAQAGSFDFSQLLNFPVPSLPAGLPPEVTQQLAMVQALIAQFQSMFAGQFAFVQNLIASQIGPILAQLQGMVATVCPEA